MRLILANQSYYDEYMERASARVNVLGEQATVAAFNEASRYDEKEYMTVGSDAVVHVSGPLTYKYDFWSYYFGGTSYQGLRSKIAAAEGDTNIDRTILVFDTPGGEVTGIKEISEFIANCSKPVIAVVDPCCASAGLWLAASCDRIVSIPSGETGSLGVQCVAVSYAEYYKKNGVDVAIFRASISPDKNLAHPYEERSEAAVEYLQSRVDKAGNQFVAWVANGRNVSESVVLEKFGKGRMLDADEALSVGLIDGIGSLESVLSEGRGSKPAPRKTARVKRRPVY